MPQHVISFRQFAVLVELHWLELRRRAEKIIWPDLGLEPDELVNMMVLQADQHLSHNPIRSFHTWTWRAMLGLALRHASQRRPEQLEPAFFDELIDCALSPEIRVLQNEADAQLVTAIKSLRSNMAEPLSLRLSGLSIAEIAQRLGIPPKTVASRCQVGVRLLQAYYYRLALISERETTTLRPNERA